MENNSNSKIRNINTKRIERLRKKKIQRIKRVIVIATTSIVIISGLFFVHEATKEPVIPEGYEQIYIEEQVDHNDTLYDIAKKYYDDEVYSLYYKSFNKYVNAIQEENHTLNNINPYQSVRIPALVPNDNIYIQQIEALNQEINKLDRWVPYTIQYGDTILGLAFQGSGTTNEAYTIKDDIISHNNLDSTNLIYGQKIDIVNPEIGNKRKEIETLKEKLIQSLKINNNEEEKANKVY